MAVSGASGLIGRHIVSVLLALSRAYKLNLKVIAIARDQKKLEHAFVAFQDEPSLVLRPCDIAQAGSWPTEATHFVHAASPATPLLFATQPTSVILANVLGTLHALQTAVDSGAYVLFLSSSESYGVVGEHELTADGLISESSLGLINPLDVRSAYPESKRMSETLVIAYAAQFGVRGDIVRVSHTYGPGVADDDNRVQVQFAKQAAAGETIAIKSDGRLMRHYTYAADCAAAVLRVLETNRQRNQPEAFNVADASVFISIRELAEQMLIAAGRPESDLVVGQPAAESAGWSKVTGGALDTKKIEGLGWNPQFILAEGLSRMIASMRADQD